MRQQPALQHSTENIETCFHFGICHIHQPVFLWCIFRALMSLLSLWRRTFKQRLHEPAFLESWYLQPGLGSRPPEKGIKRGISSALRPSVYSFISFARSSSFSPLCSSFNLSTLSTSNFSSLEVGVFFRVNECSAELLGGSFILSFVDCVETCVPAYYVKVKCILGK